MKVNKKLFPIIGLSLMIVMAAGEAFLLVQATGDPIYLILALVSLPLFFSMIYVLFRLKRENSEI
ncbi:MAG TPA: hypothetical protein VMV49_00250 [Candidatus Deferrimicrobium sp.]|nr:hypothetical protein [Candidatus Deferrimicrobium sp.]